MIRVKLASLKEKKRGILDTSTTLFHTLINMQKKKKSVSTTAGQKSIFLKREAALVPRGQSCKAQQPAIHQMSGLQVWRQI